MKEPFLGLPPPPSGEEEANEQVRYARIIELRDRMDLMTPVELAAVLDTNVGTLKQWRYRGVGPPYVKSEHRVFYRSCDVAAYLAGNLTIPMNKERFSGEEGEG